MEFSRLHCFRVDIVRLSDSTQYAACRDNVLFYCSETLQLTTFHHIINLIANYYEHLFMNKREKAEALNWSQRYIHVHYDNHTCE